MAELCQYFGMQEPDVQKMLRAADTNGDGEIEYNNFLAAAFDKKKLLSEDNLRRAFKMLDRLETGFINKTDLMIVLGGTPERKQELDRIWEAMLQDVD